MIFLLFLQSCSGYKIEDNKVFYYSWNEAQYFFNLELTANPKTFQILSSEYAKDNEKVWHKSDELTEADSSTFKHIYDYISVDKNYIFIGANKYPVHDYISFSHISGPYCRDKIDGYYMGKRMYSNKPLSIQVVLRDIQEFADNDYFGKSLNKVFQLLFLNKDDSWSHDSENYFFIGKKVEDIDFGSFEIYTQYFFTPGYTKDRYHVFYNFSILDDVDPSTFTYLKSGWAKDKNHVLFDGKVLEHIDVETFIIPSNSLFIGTDKNHKYQFGKVLDE